MSKGRKPISSTGLGLRSLSVVTAENAQAASVNYKTIDRNDPNTSARMTVNRTPEFDAAVLNIHDRHPNWSYSSIVRNSVECLDLLEHTLASSPGTQLAIVDDSGKVLNYVVLHELELYVTNI